MALVADGPISNGEGGRSAQRHMMAHQDFAA